MKINFKNFFWHNYQDIVSLAILGNDIYAVRLNFLNVWGIKNIEHITIDENYTEAQLISAVKNMLEHISVIKRPLFLCLETEHIRSYKTSFPAMSGQELKQAVYWEIRGNPAAKDKYCSYICQNQTSDTEIVLGEKPFIDSLIAACQKIGFQIVGIFPISQIKINKTDENLFTLSLDDSKISCKVDTDTEFPSYLSALVQNILLKDSTLNLLPEKKKPPYLNWFHIDLTLIAFAAAFLIFSLAIFYSEQSDIQAELIEQQQNLTKLHPVEQQKIHFEQYEDDAKKRKNILLKIKTQNISAYALLSNLGSIYPEALWLDSVKTDENGDILLIGRSPDYYMLDEYIGELKEDFPEIALLTGENKTNNEEINFTLKIPHKE